MPRTSRISYFTRAGEIPAVVDFNLKLMPGEAHGHRRRVRLRQVDRGARHHAATWARTAASSAARSCFKGRDMTHDERGGAAPASAARRSPWSIRSRWPRSTRRCRSAEQLAGGADLSTRGVTRGGGARRGRARCSAQRPAARPAAHHGVLSAPDLGRPAAARRHRHGAAVQPGAAAPRRADDRARRDGRGRHRRPDQGDRRPSSAPR